MNIKIDNKLIGKLIGIFNIFLGFFYLASPLIYSVAYKIFILPDLNQMYTDLNINTRPSFVFTYIILGIMIIIGAVSLFLGLNIIKNKESKYLKFGISFAIVTLFLYGILIGAANLPVILLLYNSTSKF